MPSLLPCISACPQCGEGQLLSQGRSQCLPWCLASAPAPSVERDSCSAKEEVNAFLGALRQHPPQSGEGQLLSQGRSQCLPWCLASTSTPEWSGTAAQPRNRSMPSLVPCVSACPQCGEGQLLSQGRSQCLPWCLASAPAPSVERDSCSAKEEVNAFLGALRQYPPQSGEGQLLSQGIGQCLSWCLASVPAPSVERDSCSAKVEVSCSAKGQLLSQGRSQCLPWCLASVSTPEWRGTAAQPRNRSMPLLVPCVSACPQCGEGQLLSQGRSQCLPWCLASAPAPSVERDSCSAKEEVNAFLGALRQHPPQSGEGQLLSQGRSQCLPWCLASASTPEWRGTAAQPRNTAAQCLPRPR